MITISESWAFLRISADRFGFSWEGGDLRGGICVAARSTLFRFEQEAAPLRQAHRQSHFHRQHLEPVQRNFQRLETQK
jgi:hypothetical protein